MFKLIVYDPFFVLMKVGVMLLFFFKKKKRKKRENKIEGEVLTVHPPSGGRGRSSIVVMVKNCWFRVAEC